MAGWRTSPTLHLLPVVEEAGRPPLLDALPWSTTGQCGLTRRCPSAGITVVGRRGSMSVLLDAPIPLLVELNATLLRLWQSSSSNLAGPLPSSAAFSPAADYAQASTSSTPQGTLKEENQTRLEEAE